MMHYKGVPVGSYYVIAEFASVRIIFGATVILSKNCFGTFQIIRNKADTQFRPYHTSLLLTKSFISLETLKLLQHAADSEFLIAVMMELRSRVHVEHCIIVICLFFSYC